MFNEIVYLYPAAIPLTDFNLQDDGAGVYISYWNTSKLGAQPTSGAISAVSTPANVVKVHEVTMRQARLVLLQAGKLAQVDVAIAAMTGAAGDAARIEWEYSNTLRRTQPLVTSMGALLGLSSADIDNLFATANTI